MSRINLDNPNNHHPPPGSVSGVLSIQDLMNIYAFLNQLTDPTETIKKAKANLENVILEFTASLGSRPQ